MSELVRKSVVDQAADHLREQILGGEIMPGTRLRETWLARRLGVSRNTLRETLLRLERESLVRHEPNRGARVAAPGPTDVDDVFAVRRVLEVAGLERVAEGRPGSLAPLARAVEAIESRAERGDWEGYANAEAVFHGALVDALGSRRMSDLHRRALGELRLALIAVDRAHDPSAPRGHVAEHRRILGALRSGATTKARALLLRHLDEAADAIRRQRSA